MRSLAGSSTFYAILFVTFLFLRRQPPSWAASGAGRTIVHIAHRAIVEAKSTEDLLKTVAVKYVGSSEQMIPMIHD
jgi:hypothetical protein